MQRIMRHKFVGNYECEVIHTFFGYSFGVEMSDDHLWNMGFVGAI